MLAFTGEPPNTVSLAMTRFMTPSYFSQSQLDAVTASLKRLGINDDEGTRIFIIALEYELAEFEKLSPSESHSHSEKPLPPSTALAKLAAAATEVIEQLDALPETDNESLLIDLSENDPYAREHTPFYLAALKNELTRVAATGRDHPAEETATHKLDEADRQFILKVAEAYFECFEAKPTAGDGKPFFALLKDIVTVCGLEIRLTHEELKQLLH